MTTNDQPRFFQALTVVAETYGRELSEAAMALYFKSLADLPIERVEAALGAGLCSNRFMPTIAEIRERAGAGGTDKKATSLYAWHEAYRATASTGAYDSVVVHDPATAFAIEHMGGWVEFCRDPRETVWIEKQFRELYEAYRGSPTAVATLLLGEHESGDTRVGRLRAAKRRGEIRHVSVLLGLPEAQRLALPEPSE